MSTDGILPNSSTDFSAGDDSPRSLSDVIQILSDFLQTRVNGELDIKSSSYDPTYQETIFKVGRYLRDIDIKENPNGTRSRKTERVIRQLEPLLHRKFKLLEDKVRYWKELRKPLMKKLEGYVNTLNRNCKLYTSVRLLASTVDVTGSVGGLLMDPESEWAKYAFTAATVCGLCGFISSFLELDSSKKILEEISECRKEDYKLLTSVKKWFEENRELDWVVQDLFPHGIDIERAKDEHCCQINDDLNEMEEYMKVFHTALVSNVARDSKLILDKDFLYSLKLFSNSDAARLWFNRAIFRKHSFHLDYNRMMLQVEFGQLQHIVYQCIPALPLEQQRLSSLPVGGRIMLNLLTMYDAASDLKTGAKSKYSNKLVKLLKEMEREEEIIDGALLKMKPRHNGIEFRRSI